MRRKAIRLLGAMALVLVLASGVTLAQSFNFIVCTTDPCKGTPQQDVIQETQNSETIKALASDDFVDPNGGADTVYGGRGPDLIDLVIDDDGTEDYAYGGRGNDSIGAFDGNKDVINCGSGREDHVYYDEGLDEIKNCEKKHPNAPTPRAP